MAWTGLTLTVDGRNTLNYAQTSNRMNIKSIVVGDGTAPANFNTMKGLVHQLYEITELKIDIVDDGCSITADFPVLDYDYYFREIGVLVTTDNGDVLYVYDNCGNDAQYIVSSTGVEKNKKRLNLKLLISDVSEITVSNPSILYVTYDDFEKAIETLEQKKLSLDGNASNVTVSFNQAAELTTIASGEKLSVIFGKIKKAIANLISHLADTVTHITESEREKWNTVTNKVDEVAGKQLSTNDYTTNEKNKLDGIEERANNYTHPTGAGNKHIPSGGVAGQFLKWSASGTAVWSTDNNTTYGKATQTADGLMSKADKTKLDGMETNANNYVHPSTHPASIITQDSTHRFVSDIEKSKWNAKMETTSDAADNTVSFTPAGTRSNISSGEKLSVIFGKIARYFADLKTVAFTGSYSDLTNKPTIPTIPSALKNPNALKVNGKTYDGSAAVDVGTVGLAYGGTGATTAAAARTNLGLGTAATQGVANNLITTAAGYALDARQGKVLKEEVDELNGRLSSTKDYLSLELAKKQNKEWTFIGEASGEKAYISCPISSYREYALYVLGDGNNNMHQFVYCPVFVDWGNAMYLSDGAYSTSASSINSTYCSVAVMPSGVQINEFVAGGVEIKPKTHMWLCGR